uniref:Delphilin n=1 Tax=Ciona intestinalis TaxID=7719 RepID=H2XNJ8_CIOIN
MPARYPVWPGSFGFIIYGCGPSFIVDVRPGSVAEESGLKPGDQILQVNEQEVGDWDAEQIIEYVADIPSIPPSLGVVSRLKEVTLSSTMFTSRALLRRASCWRRAVEVAGHNKCKKRLIIPHFQFKLSLKHDPVEMRNVVEAIQNYSSVKNMDGFVEQICKSLQKVEKRKKLLDEVRYFIPNRDKHDFDKLVDKYWPNEEDKEPAFSKEDESRRSLRIPASGRTDVAIQNISPETTYVEKLLRELHTTNSLPFSHRSVQVKRGSRSFGLTLCGHAPVSIQSVDEGSPAYEAGLKDGDYILALNGIDLRNLDHTKAVALIQGSGSMPTLVIQSSSGGLPQASEDDASNLLSVVTSLDDCSWASYFVPDSFTIRGVSFKEHLMKFLPRTDVLKLKATLEEFSSTRNLDVFLVNVYPIVKNMSAGGQNIIYYLQYSMTSQEREKFKQKLAEFAKFNGTEKPRSSRVRRRQSLRNSDTDYSVESSSVAVRSAWSQGGHPFSYNCSPTDNTLCCLSSTPHKQHFHQKTNSQETEIGIKNPGVSKTRSRMSTKSTNLDDLMRNQSTSVQQPTIQEAQNPHLFTPTQQPTYNQQQPVSSGFRSSQSRISNSTRQSSLRRSESAGGHDVRREPESGGNWEQSCFNNMPDELRQKKGYLSSIKKRLTFSRPPKNTDTDTFLTELSAQFDEAMNLIDDIVLPEEEETIKYEPSPVAEPVSGQRSTDRERVRRRRRRGTESSVSKIDDMSSPPTQSPPIPNFPVPVAAQTSQQEEIPPPPPPLPDVLSPPPIPPPPPPPPPLSPPMMFKNSPHDTPVRMSVKRINWEKIEPVDLGNTVWGQLGEDYDTINDVVKYLDLEEHFAMKKAKTFKKKTEPVKKDVISILAHKKAYNTSILLAHLKMTTTEISNCLLINASEATRKKLDVSHYQQLLLYAPDDEEVLNLKKFTGDLSKLNEADTLALKLVRIPGYQLRLKALVFKHSFAEKEEEIQKNLEVIQRASNQLRKSRKLAKILEFVLAMGNYMNQGHIRISKATGFRIHFLAEMDCTKTSDNKMTFLHILARAVSSKFPEVLSFADELLDVKAASRVVYPVVLADLQQIRKNWLHIRDNLLETESKKKEDRFKIAMETCLVRTNGSIKQLEQLHHATSKEFNKVAQYFGENPKNIGMQQFFNIFEEFIRKFQKSSMEISKLIKSKQASS